MNNSARFSNAFGASGKTARLSSASSQSYVGRAHPHHISTTPQHSSESHGTPHKFCRAACYQTSHRVTFTGPWRCSYLRSFTCLPKDAVTIQEGVAVGDGARHHVRRSPQTISYVVGVLRRTVAHVAAGGRVGNKNHQQL